MLVEIMIPLFI